jgi:release factor glutamine methyltransferase
MTITEQYQLISEQLQRLYSKGEANTISSWVLEHYTGLNRMAVKTNGHRGLSIHEKQLIAGALKDLLKHRPVQYVLGEAWFKNMAFYVDESVLIPRPETEELVDWVVECSKSKLAGNRVLEIGTGSGCIAIAIKTALPANSLTALDISEPALAIARKNAERLKTPIQFLASDFLEESNWEALPKYAVIASNPPYIPISEKAKLDKNVTAWEPGVALFVPDNDPLLFYRKIAAFGKKHLEKDGVIFVECHQDFAKATQEMFVAMGYETQLKKDLFDNERMLKAVLS